MIKKTTFFSVIILILFVCRIKAQAILGITQVSFVDSTYYGNHDVYHININNLSSFAYTGSAFIQVSVDSSNNAKDSLKSLNTKAVNLTIAANSYQSDTVSVSITNNLFRRGINTVIIWPVNDPQSVNQFIIKDSLKLQINVLGYTGQKEMENYDKENILLFPNPSQDYIYIRNIDSKFNIERVRILNMYGQVVEDVPFRGTINISKLNQGTYVIEFINRSNQIRRYKAIKE